MAEWLLVFVVRTTAKTTTRSARECAEDKPGIPQNRSFSKAYIEAVLTAAKQTARRVCFKETADFSLCTFP